MKCLLLLAWAQLTHRSAMVIEECWSDFQNVLFSKKAGYLDFSVKSLRFSNVGNWFKPSNSIEYNPNMFVGLSQLEI